MRKQTLTATIFIMKCTKERVIRLQNVHCRAWSDQSHTTSTAPYNLEMATKSSTSPSGLEPALSNCFFQLGTIESHHLSFHHVYLSERKPFSFEDTPFPLSLAKMWCSIEKSLDPSRALPGCCKNWPCPGWNQDTWQKLQGMYYRSSLMQWCLKILVYKAFPIMPLKVAILPQMWFIWYWVQVCSFWVLFTLIGDVRIQVFTWTKSSLNTRGFSSY